jgi:predicted GIY-YIG superfamily endonuclease
MAKPILDIPDDPDYHLKYAERSRIHVNSCYKNNIMGVYHRVELLKANCFFDTYEAINTIYIYKITSVNTGHFYIGQTASIKDRMYSHLKIILAVLENQNPTGVLNFHRVVSDKIMELYEKDKRLKIERYLRESLHVYVMAITADKETAGLVESHYIKKNMSDPLCLNVKN